MQFDFPPMTAHQFTKCVTALIEILYPNIDSHDVWYKKFTQGGGYSWSWYHPQPELYSDYPCSAQSVFITDDVYITPFACMYLGFKPRDIPSRISQLSSRLPRFLWNR